MYENYLFNNTLQCFHIITWRDIIIKFEKLMKFINANHARSFRQYTNMKTDKKTRMIDILYVT